MKKLFAATLCLLLFFMVFSACLEQSEYKPDAMAPEEQYSETTTEKITIETNESSNETTVGDLNIGDKFIADDYLCKIIDNNKIEISYLGTDEHIVIPTEISGWTVTALSDNEAFALVKNTIISVVIPETVTNIGERAFANCIKLETVTLPDSLTRIESYVFWGCSSLKHIKVPACLEENWSWGVFANSGLETIEFSDGIQVIPAYCFEGTNLKEIIIPESVQLIGYNAFKDCTQLERIFLNEGLEIIEANAFQNCPIKEIIIPSTVTDIQEIAFAHCMQLTAVKFEGDAPKEYKKPDMDPDIFGLSQVQYTVYYHKDAAGFSSPTWNGYHSQQW